MAKKTKSEFVWMDYPQHDAFRSGCKVSWYYYRDIEKAREASIAAIHNAARQWELGYDFGYCSPGSIYGPDKQNFHPGMWEVCIP